MTTTANSAQPQLTGQPTTESIRRATGFACLTVSVVTVSSSALIIRVAQEGASSLAIAAWRTTIAAAVVLLWTVPRRHKAIATLTKRDLALISTSGVCLGIHFAGWIMSLAWTSIAVSVTVVNLAPLLVAAASPWITGESPTRRVVSGALTATIGAALIGASAEQAVGRNDLLGIALAFLGAISLGGYLLVGRAARDRLPLDVYVAGVYTVAAITLAIAALVTDVPLTGYGVRSWTAIVALALVCQIIGHTATNVALRSITASAVSTTLLAEPVLASAAAYVLLGETVGPLQFAGAAAILAGILMAAAGEKRQPTAPPS